MIIKQLELQDGLYKKTIVFDNKVNLIYSSNNSSGKTTLIRCILYSMCYMIPSTKGINFDEMSFNLKIQNAKGEMQIFRQNEYVEITIGSNIQIFSLPTDFLEIQTLIWDNNNRSIIYNLLGAFYVDQEKGWTLLNRGKVIGNIPFNIDALIRGISNIDCDDKLKKMMSVKNELQKYRYMLSVSDYQKQINELQQNIIFDEQSDAISKKIELLQVEKEPIEEELRQIKSILRQNNNLIKYLDSLKLMVYDKDGEPIYVTKDTLVGYSDNMSFLAARREILAAELSEINKKIDKLKIQEEKDGSIVNVQTIIQAFDSDISKISVDAIATQKVIKMLEKEKSELNEEIRKATRSDDKLILQLHGYISKYAKQLGVDEKYVSANKDYIFTHDLKSLSGTIFHKIVFSFKLSYIKIIRERTGIILPIILDSPSGREIKSQTVKEMLDLLIKEYHDHQIIIASIYNYDLSNTTLIELKNQLFEMTDIINCN